MDQLKRFKKVKQMSVKFKEKHKSVSDQIKILKYRTVLNILLERNLMMAMMMEYPPSPRRKETL